MTTPTASELVRIYMDTLNSAPDAWGQYCHPTYGASHWIMLRLIQMVGSAETTRLIKLANYDRAAARARMPDGSISASRYIAECDRADHAATKGFTCQWCGVRNNNDAVSCIHCNGV